MSLDLRAGSFIRRSYSTILSRIALAGAVLCAGTAFGALTIVDMNFNGGTGVENPGDGPDGVLKNGASIVGGQLITNGTKLAEPDGAGLDLNFNGFNTFSGAQDFNVSFDFALANGDLRGPLFSADGGKFVNDNGGAGEFPHGQQGGVNIIVRADQNPQRVIADLWFIGEARFNMPAGFPLNDGNMHHLALSYNSSAKQLTLNIDGLTPTNNPQLATLNVGSVEGFENGFLRDTSHDIVRLGDQTNEDVFSASLTNANNLCNCKFDNLLISGAPPSPVKLFVDRVTGELKMEVISATPATINGIEVVSPTGTLDTAEYAGLGALGGVFAGWSVSQSSSTKIVEGGAAVTLMPGQTFTLGDDIWRPFLTEDVVLGVNDPVFALLNGSTTFENGTTLVAGDLDADHDIDVDDYVLFRDRFDVSIAGATKYNAYYQGADINRDGTRNYLDWIVFSTAYDNAHGDGAFLALVAGSVPEPSSLLLLAITLGGLATIRRRNLRRTATGALTCVLLALAINSSADAAQLVEYLFTSNFNDTSGNNRTGVPDVGLFGGTPTVSDGKLNLTGDVGEGVIVPLGAANPFDGLSNYTIEMTFNSTGNSFVPNAGVVLLGSADATTPTLPANQSFSIYVEPASEGGALVVDYYFLDNVKVGGVPFLDGNDHTFKAAYVAPPAPAGNNPGTFFINVDGNWLATDKFAPRPPTIANHEVRIGGSLNTDFPFECEEGACLTAELQGTVDNFRVSNDAVAPTLLRATVDLTSGEVKMLGGEYHRDIQYYELTSQSGRLKPENWFSLQEQGLNSIGAGAGQHWDELAATNTQLAESFLLGSSLLTQSSQISFGNVFQTGALNDVLLNVVLTNHQVLAVDVSYINPPAHLDGDYNGNGIVDAADYVVWRELRGQAGAGLAADGDGNLVVNDLDYTYWKARFGNTLSGSGQSVEGLATVPEPSFWLLAAAASTLCVGTRRKLSR